MKTAYDYEKPPERLPSGIHLRKDTHGSLWIGIGTLEAMLTARTLNHLVRAAANMLELSMQEVLATEPLHAVELMDETFTEDDS